MQANAVQPGKPRSNLPSWRFIVGALLHCIGPAYFITIVIAYVTDSPISHSRVALLQLFLTISAKFLLIYSLATVAAALMAHLVASVAARRQAQQSRSDPATAVRLSSARWQTTLAQATAIALDANGRAAAALAGLRGEALDHADPQVQQLGKDSEQAVQAFATALATAPMTRREAMAEAAADTLTELARAAHAFALERSLRDEREARTTGRYIELRYGNSPELECSGPPID